ncbi:MAG: 50S ribosomal protein L11 methyltransferase [Hyphomicrobiales bacterium]|nr:50S ribosomal protein L11 methyltransferase [Hyphomicrobiales bacterium]
MWRITVEQVPERAVARFETALEPLSQSVSALEKTPGLWRVVGVCNQTPDRSHVDVLIALAAAAAEIAPPSVAIEPIVQQDWVAHGMRDLHPLRIGRFFVYGSHRSQPVPPGLVGLEINASMAFGTGHHASTAGCLLAFSRQSNLRPRRVLDMGCGSAVLAIAAAKLWRAQVLAVDVDPDAVAESVVNARSNGVAQLVKPVLANGYASPAIVRADPFDLIVSNILARPLKRMARQLAGTLAPGGRAVLSGFIRRDAADVLALHKAFGLIMHARIEAEGWTTLILRKTDPATDVRNAHVSG